MTFRRWIRQVEPIAYGDLGLRPWEFAALTPREFALLVSGRRRRAEDRWLELATLGAWLLLPHTKRDHELTPEMLLGWPANWQVGRRKEREQEQHGSRDLQPARPRRRTRSRE